MIYFVIFGGFILLDCFYFKNMNANFTIQKNRKTRIMCILMFFLSSIRSYNVGYDTKTLFQYFYYYKKYGFFNKLINMEIGNKIVIEIISMFSNNPRIWMVLMSATLYFGIYLFIITNSEKPTFSCLCFFGMFFLNSMNICRQYVAIAIGINSFQLIKQKKYAPAILLIIIASFFHRIALIYLLILLISLFGKNRKSIIIFPFIGIIIAFSEHFIKNIFNVFFPKLSYYFTGKLYLGENGLSKLTLILLLFLIYGILIEYGMKYKNGKLVFNKSSDVSEKDRMLYEILIIALGLSAVSTTYLLVSRMGEALNIFFIILFPHILSLTRFKSLYKFIVYAFLFIYIIVIIKSNNIGVYPYHTFLFDMYR